MSSVRSIRLQYRGYLKMIKKEAGDTFDTFVSKVRAAAKNPKELPVEIVFQYLDEDDELIDVKNDQDLKDCLELVQKPKFCIRDYSVLNPANASTIISNSQLTSSQSDSKRESAILVTEIASSSKRQDSMRQDECREFSLPLKKQEISRPQKRDYRNQIYRLFNPEAAGRVGGPEITEKDLQQNSLAAVKAIRHASRSLADSIVGQFNAWEQNWQAMRQ